MSEDRPGEAQTIRGRIRLRYFEDVLPVELAAIIERRQRMPGAIEEQPRRGWIRQLSAEPEPRVAEQPSGRAHPARRRRSPDPASLPFGPQDRAALHAARQAGPPSGVDPHRPEYDRTRPEPVPCTVNGLALSGGGIRSAAVCLGALQALNQHGRIDSIDYLSTVSGGGYIGSCLSAATSPSGGGAFPFGADVYDSRAVAHLRNYSNYLLPRGRSAIRNLSEAVAVLARGLLANIVLVLATLLGCALVTQLAYPKLEKGSFLPRLLDGLTLHQDGDRLNSLVGAFPFSLTLWSLALLAVELLVWAVLRSIPRLDRFTDDTRSWFLRVARVLIVWISVMAFLDLQPIAIQGFVDLLDALKNASPNYGALKTLAGGFAAFSTVISVLSSWLGHFLKTSEHATSWTTLGLRILTYLALVAASLVLPLGLWVSYLALSAWSIHEWPIPEALLWLAPWSRSPPPVWQLYLLVFAVLAIVSLCLRANGYSLHRLYRDRLSKAFLFKAGAPASSDDPPPLDHLKLSDLAHSVGPYHIINSAMNVQGSREANRRGRNADFFMFTRDFVGSDLTLYGPTRETIAATSDMERIDSRLDLATAMAISGAAISANMGASTVRLLSPTLALLNIRLGYWMRNPRDLAQAPSLRRKLRSSFGWVLERFYLVAEMLNLLDEESRNVYLTDGGHIENLGVYELLKRGCQTIIVIDAEADPTMSFGSLLALERYARIDLGVRIALPWEPIAKMSMMYSSAQGQMAPQRGPHCAVGRILYQNGAQGIIVYFKSSLTGDEKDYILDYKKRYSEFPHESTGDQFFSEEQFEVYRALGYHMIDGFLAGTDNFVWLANGPGAFADAADALAQVTAAVPAIA
jgi:hypothetical protein